jgi:hypothetical protein
MNSSKTNDYLLHAWLYPSTELAKFNGIVFGFLALLPFSQYFFLISYIFVLNTTKETSLVGMPICCIKIGVVLVLHFNP